MAAFREGRVVGAPSDAHGSIRARIDIDGRLIDAIAYPAMTPAPRDGDRVIVNTTGIDLQLGTGGIGFILWNLDREPDPAQTEGHIVKLRYTPWQMNVLSVEAPEGPHHEVMADAATLDGMPVVACSLHSQVPAVAASIKAALPESRVGYLMTDGGALPIGFSDLVARMKQAALIDVTCTTGHAFGGDLESVNVFSGMLALRHVAGCDVVVAAMGPGVVGTGTSFGHTALEQGQLLDAATALEGRAIAALRISFDDDRPRHRGISHHSRTALTVAARESATVAVPKLRPERSKVLEQQLQGSSICERHHIVIEDGRPGVRLLLERDLNPTSMGRRMTDAPELWLAAAAAGAAATVAGTADE